MTVDAGTPILLPPSKTEAAFEGKRTMKRSKKDGLPASADGSETVAAAPKGGPRKRVSSKSPDPAGGGDVAPLLSEEERPGGEGSANPLVVAKAVRTLLKNHTTPMHCGSDALPALNSKIAEIIYEAIGRALANGRKTLKNSDF